MGRTRPAGTPDSIIGGFRIATHSHLVYPGVSHPEIPMGQILRLPARPAGHADVATDLDRVERVVLIRCVPSLGRTGVDGAGGRRCGPCGRT